LATQTKKRLKDSDLPFQLLSREKPFCYRQLRNHDPARNSLLSIAQLREALLLQFMQGQVIVALIQLSIAQLREAPALRAWENRSPTRLPRSFNRSCAGRSLITDFTYEEGYCGIVFQSLSREPFSYHLYLVGCGWVPSQVLSIAQARPVLLLLHGLILAVAFNNALSITRAREALLLLQSSSLCRIRQCSFQSLKREKPFFSFQSLGRDRPSCYCKTGHPSPFFASSFNRSVTDGSFATSGDYYDCRFRPGLSIAQPRMALLLQHHTDQIKD
jgi:hypothetical protein